MLKKLVLFACLLWSTGADAVGFSQKMEVEIGVFDAAAITLDYNEGGGRYDIKAAVATANLFDTLYPFFGQYQSVGKVLKNGELQPEEYKTSNKTRSHMRRKNVYYDLQTVFAELIKKFRAKKSCAMVREVFDRKKHYKVIIKDTGRENRLFEGLNRTENAYKCSIYIENLKNNNDNILWDVSAEKPIKVWIGYDEKVKMPYLLEIKIDSTPLGELKVTPRTLDFK